MHTTCNVTGSWVAAAGAAWAWVPCWLSVDAGAAAGSGSLPPPHAATPSTSRAMAATATTVRHDQTPSPAERNLFTFNIDPPSRVNVRPRRPAKSFADAPATGQFDWRHTLTAAPRSVNDSGGSHVL